MVTTSEIQHTRLKGELVFQEFCLKLVRQYWQDDYAEAFGRSGQNQRGVDIVGGDSRNGYPHAGMQCKASETDDPRQLTTIELAAEVEKAKKYRPKLDILIVAYERREPQISTYDSVLSKIGLLRFFRQIVNLSQHVQGGLLESHDLEIRGVAERADEEPAILDDGQA